MSQLSRVPRRARASCILSRGLAVVVAAGLAACSSKSGQPAAEPVAEPGAGAYPPAEQPEGPLTPEERIAKAILRLGDIQKDVAELRGKAFKSPIEGAHQTAEQFRAYVKSALAEELPPDKLGALSRSMFHLGFLEEPADLAALLEDALVSQAGAYYDPKTKKFYLLMVPDTRLIIDILSAHELAHGLQDQYFDLQAYVQEGSKSGLSQDALSARRFIVEGEATLLMMLFPVYAVTRTSPLAGETGIKTVRMQIEMMAQMGLRELTAQQKQQAAMLAELGPEFEKALEAMDKIPPFILIPLLEAYTRGALPVFEAYAAGGWAAVDELYADPPQSTEQVLHPADKLVGQRDFPIEIALPRPRALAGWTEIDADVMGELLLRAYFETWSVDGGADAAAGWDGDRYAVYAKGERMLALIATTWDGDADAEAFEQAYLASLAARFPSAARRPGKRAAQLARPDGTEILVARRGADVFVVDGADAGKGAALLDALQREARKTRHPGDR